MSFLSLSKANIGYNGVPVFREITLSIEEGEQVALVGSSGAGKSTLLATLFAQQEKRITLIPQDISLVKQLSVFHNVYMGRLDQHNALYNLLNLIRPMQSEVEKIKPVLQTLELEDRLETQVGELSGGEQQRTAVARAVFHGGMALLGDEPVSAVDPRLSRSVLETISSSFKTVVLALHDVELALAYMKRIIGIKKGRIVFDAPTEDLCPADFQSLYKRS